MYHVTTEQSHLNFIYYVRINWSVSLIEDVESSLSI